MFDLLIWYSGYSSMHPRAWFSLPGFVHPKVPRNRRLAALLVLLLLIAIMPVVATAGHAYSESSMRQALLSLYDRWEGTPYRYGGNSRHGVDCSGFVYIAFRDALGIEVPRSTELLSRCGPSVSVKHLAVGDILVFRASRDNLHVGIYVGNGQFIHSSKSRGVILSDLSNPYWRDTYVKSVRIINHRI